jgi:hypothetical protein
MATRLMDLSERAEQTRAALVAPVIAKADLAPLGQLTAKMEGAIRGPDGDPVSAGHAAILGFLGEFRSELALLDRATPDGEAKREIDRALVSIRTFAHQVIGTHGEHKLRAPYGEVSAVLSHLSAVADAANVLQSHGFAPQLVAEAKAVVRSELEEHPLDGYATRVEYLLAAAEGSKVGTLFDLPEPYAALSLPAFLRRAADDVAGAEQSPLAVFSAETPASRRQDVATALRALAGKIESRGFDGRLPSNLRITWELKGRLPGVLWSLESLARLPAEEASLAAFVA